MKNWDSSILRQKTGENEFVKCYINIVILVKASPQECWNYNYEEYIYIGIGVEKSKTACLVNIHAGKNHTKEVYIRHWEFKGENINCYTIKMVLEHDLSKNTHL